MVVKQGHLKRGMSIKFFMNSERVHTVVQVGFLHPEMVPCEVICILKNIMKNLQSTKCFQKL
jgi:hypothetical protein